MMTPCPERTTGRRASAISCAALATSSLSGYRRGRYPLSSTFSGQTNGAFCWRTSRGMSTSTGPGRPADRGDGVHPGVGDAGHDVRRPRAGRSEAHAYLPRHTGVGVGGVSGRLLMLHQVVADPGVGVGKLVVKGQVGPPGKAEDVLRSLPDQGLHHHLGSGQLLHRYTPPDSVRAIVLQLSVNQYPHTASREAADTAHTPSARACFAVTLIRRPPPPKPRKPASRTSPGRRGRGARGRRPPAPRGRP